MAVPWNKTEIKVVNNKVNVSFFSFLDFLKMFLVA